MSFPFKRLPARYGAVIVPLILSLLMTFVISAISTWRTIGFDSHFLPLWLSAWGLSWLVAFPVLLVVLPLVRRLAAMLVEPA